MADFQKCLSFVLPHEAGTPPSYEVTNDNKGQVIAGVNSLAWPADFAAIAALPIGQRPAAVYSFYQRTYWNQWIAQLTSNAVAAYTMDSEVNQGGFRGVDLLQAACIALGSTEIEDGQWGPATVAAVNGLPAETLRPALQAAREAAYERIGGPNLKGWLARAALWPPFS